MKYLSYVFAGGLAVSAAFAGERRIDGNEWQDLSRMSLGREPTRAAFAPFDDETSALAIHPWLTPRQITLDSDTAWKFKWAKDPASRPVGFEKPAYDVSGWETIKVPCSWQAMGANGKAGWGTALYTNSRYPFAVNPPRVMDTPPKDYTNYGARNPVGSYRRDFEVPAGWKGDRVFLKLDGVDSFYYLWVNGTYVGYSKDSRCAAEYDITSYLKEGRNTLALEVYRYSDGSYLEDQDMFRLSGIFRSTWLVRRPAVRIRDFFVRSRPERSGAYAGDWLMDVETELAGVGVPAAGDVSVALYAFDGSKIALETLDPAKKTFRVAKPKLWTPETPNCYKVVVSLLKDGRVLESVSTVFGFRESVVRNGRYELNGRKVKLVGANRHETDPMYGHYCPRARQEEDVKLLKRANCNIVRNSHYPQDDYWYYLCAVNGIALMDEANVETHGMGYGRRAASRDARFRTSIVWRVKNMVERNKNQPAVLFWSHGNESGAGANFKAADDWVHARDASRPTHYERDMGASDLDSCMYPSVERVWKFARNTASKRPFFICEYAHNMVNAMGNLKDYQDAIESSDVVIGGCIWDWVDQGLYTTNDKGQRVIGYGSSFGDKPTSGQFVMNGCVLSDRALEPGYFEVKHVYQPVSVLTAKDGRSAKIVNKQFFRGLDVYDAAWTVLVNGKAAASGRLDLDDVGPRGEKTVPLPAEAFAELAPGRSVSVRYSFACRARDGYLEKGYVVADDQIDLVNAYRASVLPMPAAEGLVRHRREGDRLVFDAGEVSAAFDVKKGQLVSYRVKGVERLLAPVTLDAFRAPSSNEVKPAQVWSMNGWRAFEAEAVAVGEVKTLGAALEFSLETEYSGVQMEKLTSFGYVGGRLEAKGRPRMVGRAFFRAAQVWRVWNDGTITCQSEIRPRGARRELPRIGYRFTLPLSFGKVDWFGRGPFENYRDRKSGAFKGRWSTDLATFTMPYARPEDANNFEETDAVTLSGAGGTVGFATLGAPFAFAAIPYSAKELIDADYPVELPKPSKVEFGIFAETRGLGGASCGPGPLKRDIIDTSRPYRLDFAILPRAAETAIAMPPAELPVSAPDSTVKFSGYRLHSVTSEEGGSERAAYAFDGDVATCWHTRWSKPKVPSYPHAVACDYGAVKTLKGLLVVPRQDGISNGRVRRYRVETSLDGKTWTEAAAGELPNTDEETDLVLTAPVQARYLRFTAVSPWAAGSKWACFAEIQPVFAAK